MRVVGIDFGTTTSSVAWWSGNISDEPSLVNLNPNSQTERHIIKSEVKINNGRIMRHYKLALDKSGRGEAILKRTDTAKENLRFRFDQMEQCLVPLNNDVEFSLEIEKAPIPGVGDDTFDEDELIEAVEILFDELFEKAKAYTAGDKIVLGLPLGYADLGRARVVESLKESGWIEDFSQVVLFPEPLAIALRCGLDYKTPGVQRIMVADHGGGTLDMCVFDLETIEGDFHIKVLSQKRCDIAGSKFDEYLLEWIGQRDQRVLSSFQVNSVKQIPDYSLWDAVEECKINLSSSERAEIDHPINNDHLKMEVSRADLEEAIKPGLQIIDHYIDELIGRLDKQRGIDMIFLAGGTAQIPCVRQLFENRFAGAQVMSDYAGSGVLAESLALVPQYQDLLERLCESTYGIWDYKRREVVKLVEAGSLLTPQTGNIPVSRYQIKVEFPEPPAPLILFNMLAENEWEPFAQASLPAVFEQAEIIPDFDASSGALIIRLLADGNPIDITMEKYASLRDWAPPVVRSGQVARIGEGKYNYYIAGIVGNPIGNHERYELAVGLMSMYRFNMNHYQIKASFVYDPQKHGQLRVLQLGRKTTRVDLSILPDSSFFPVIDVQGKPFSIIYPVIFEGHVESEVSPDIINEANDNRNKEISQLLTEMFVDELNKATERGRMAMQRELLQRYAAIKTRINEDLIRSSLSAWEDSELDELTQQVFSQTEPDMIMNAMQKAINQ
jgi:actin-like ATPase involved in cell morphogenesis